MTQANPWLDVPLEDYERHMRAPEVGQLSVLGDLFAEALTARRPASVAILGVAGGNGLERIDAQHTQRVVGLDCNREYLAAVAARFGRTLPLQLHCLDLSGESVDFEPVDLAHAALVLEHAGMERCLENAVALVGAHGALSVVLQLPSLQTQAVAPSGLASIQRLSAHFRLIEPGRLRAALDEAGFRLERETVRELPGGKGFWHGIFTRLAD